MIHSALQIRKHKDGEGEVPQFSNNDLYLKRKKSLKVQNPNLSDRLTRPNNRENEILLKKDFRKRKEKTDKGQTTDFIYTALYNSFNLCRVSQLEEIEIICHDQEVAVQTDNIRK